MKKTNLFIGLLAVTFSFSAFALDENTCTQALSDYKETLQQAVAFQAEANTLDFLLDEKRIDDGYINEISRKANESKAKSEGAFIVVSNLEKKLLSCLKK